MKILREAGLMGSDDEDGEDGGGGCGISFTAPEANGRG